MNFTPRIIFLYVLWIFSLFSLSDGFNGVTSTPFLLKSSYDYIIVGAGSAGCVLAGRLSEDPDVTVLLLEAGGDDRLNFVMSTPLTAGLLYGSENVDWSYHSEPSDHEGLDDGVSVWAAGRVLGGSSSINGMMYTRGSRNDFNKWASYTKDDSWNYQHILPYFIKSEGTTDSSLAASAYHGTSGPYANRGTEVVTELPEIFVKAAQEAGYPVNDDYNGATQLGAAIAQSNIHNGVRVSAATAYLHPALDRPNLDVAVHAQVTKIVTRLRTAQGVEVNFRFLSRTIRARREVIISSGTMGSPKILQLSGIGPREHLRSLGIPVVANLPVGHNFQDHPAFDVSFKTRRKISLNYASFVNPISISQYLKDKTGPFTSAVNTEGTFFVALTEENENMDSADLQFVVVGFPSSEFVARQYNWADEMREALSGRNRNRHGFFLLITGMHPKSRGTILIKSTDPNDPPAIVPNYLDDQDDVDVIVKGIEIAQQIGASPAFQAVGAELTESESYFPCEGETFNTPAFWECAVRAKVMPTYHQVGTCKMGPARDPTAVVDSQLRVHRVNKLRVVDASVMPWVVTGNTNAPTLMIAEKIADVIRGIAPPDPLDL